MVSPNYRVKVHKAAGCEFVAMDATNADTNLGG